MPAKMTEQEDARRLPQRIESEQRSMRDELARALVAKADEVQAHVRYALDSLSVARQERGEGILSHEQWLNVQGALDASAAPSERVRCWASSPDAHADTEDRQQASEPR